MKLISRSDESLAEFQGRVTQARREGRDVERAIERAEAAQAQLEKFETQFEEALEEVRADFEEAAARA